MKTFIVKYNGETVRIKADSFQLGDYCISFFVENPNNTPKKATVAMVPIDSIIVEGKYLY